MSVEANKTIVRGYVDAILVKRDFSKFNEFTAPGFYIDRSAVPEAIKEKMHCIAKWTCFMVHFQT